MGNRADAKRRVLRKLVPEGETSNPSSSHPHALLAPGLKGIFHHQRDVLDPHDDDFWSQVAPPTGGSDDRTRSARRRDVHRLAEGDLDALADVFESEQRVDPEMADLPLVHGYKICTFLGSGAFGIVVKVVKGGRLFAMKVLEESPTNESLNELLRGEAKFLEENLLGCSTPNIVQFFEVFELDSDPFQKEGEREQQKKKFLCVVMEYVKGTDLNQLLERAEGSDFVLSAPLSVKWFLELLSAMEFLASKMLVHGDIKPGNVLVYHQGIIRSPVRNQHTIRSAAAIQSMMIKLADFGLGSSADPEKRFGNDEGSKKVMGSVIFCAPEVLTGQKYDVRCDVWSLGLLLHMMYFGISHETYNEAIECMFSFLETDERHRRQFVDMFGDAFELHDVMAYLAAENLVWEEIVIPAAGEEPAVAEVLRKMVCRKEDRLTASEVGELPQVLTWKLALGLCRNATEREMARENLDLESLFVLLRDSAPRDIEAVKSCLEILIEQSKMESLTRLEEERCIEAVCRQGKTILEDVDLGWLVIRLFAVLLAENKPTTVREISLAVRGLGFLDVVHKMLSAVAASEDVLPASPYQNPQALVEFASLVAQSCPTIAQRIGNVAAELIAAVERGIHPEFERILDPVLPGLSDEDVIPRILEAKHVAKYFGPFERLSLAWKKTEFAPKLIDSIRVCLEELCDLDEEERNQIHVRNLIYLLLHLSFAVVPSRSDFQLSLSPEAKVASLKYKETPRAIHVVAHENHFCVRLLQGRTVLTSSEVLCSREESGEDGTKEVAAYYEVSVQDGGLADHLEVGFQVGAKEDVSQVIVIPSESSYFSGSSEPLSLETESAFPLSSNSTCGIGILADKTLFLTVNGVLVRFPSETVIRVSSLQNVAALLVIHKNVDFVADVNFGAKPFLFQFSVGAGQEELPVDDAVACDDGDALLRTIRDIPSISASLERLIAGAGTQDKLKRVIGVMKSHLASGIVVINEDELL